MSDLLRLVGAVLALAAIWVTFADEPSTALTLWPLAYAVTALGALFRED